MARKTRHGLTCSFEEAYERFLRLCSAQNYSDSTINGYRVVYRRFAEFMDVKALRDIEVHHVIEFMNHLRTVKIAPPGAAARPARKLAPKTLRNHHGALSSLWSWAVKIDPDIEHVMQHVPAPSAPRKPVHPTPSEDIVKLVKACEETAPYHNNVWASNFRSTCERDKLIILLLLDTCMRNGELCNLKMKDVTFQRGGGTCYIRKAKHNKSRHVSFGKRAYLALEAWLAVRGDVEEDDYLICNWTRNKGTKMSRDSVGRLLRRLSERAGIKPHVYPHQLRHTGAVELARQGVSAFQLQRIMGHADVSQTMQYIEAANLNEQEVQRMKSPVDRLRL